MALLQNFNFQPVIIIGAGRSGTNMLRDLLTSLPRCATWPCDEINYIWRYGNARVATDELTAEHARPEVVRYIRRQFQQLADRTGAQWVIEKTCANSLRVDFVYSVLPEAKFIFLVRDGADVATSAARRWRASLDLRYLMQKAAYVPVRDLPYYALRYAGHRFRKVIHRENRLPTWGPQCARLSEWTAKFSTLEVCLRQWQACVEQASEQLAKLPRGRVHFVRYEELVTRPADELPKICSFLGTEIEQPMLTRLAKTLYCDSIRKDSRPNWHEQASISRATLAGVSKVWQTNHHSALRIA